MWRQASVVEPFSCYPEFSFSGYLLLTDCYIVNHWWLTLCAVHQFSFFHWIQREQEKAHILALVLSQVLIVWFSKHPRKPPDKICRAFQQPYSIVPNIYDTILDACTYILMIIEDSLFHLCGINIDLSITLYILWNIIWDYATDLLSIILQVEFNYQTNVEEGEDWIATNTADIPLITVNK